jgi:hypothetical protein
MEPTTGSLPTTQALCPGGITAVSPGPNSSSAPSSMTTLILPETIYTEYVVLDNYLFFDRFHAFLPAPAWFQYGSTNRYITEICKFNLPFSLIVQCYKDRLAIIIVVIEVNK